MKLRDLLSQHNNQTTKTSTPQRVEKIGIYLAGEMQSNWREEILGCSIIMPDDEVNNYPVIKNAVMGKYDYVGPYKLKEGCEKGKMHGECISKSDFVFVWVDISDDGFDMNELSFYLAGYADGLGKKNTICYSHEFVKKHASVPMISYVNPKEALEDVLRKHFYIDPKEELCESPIELHFYKNIKDYVEITPQHEVGNFRIDFAILDKKIGIEIDGHEYHKTKEQRTNDAKRERFLKRNGWDIIRFTGSEIFNDIDSCVSELLEYIGGNKDKIIKRNEASNQKKIMWESLCLALNKKDELLTSFMVQHVNLIDITDDKIILKLKGDKLHLIENVAYNLYGKIYKIEMS